MSITTYYDTLHVSRNASEKEIKKQYKILAKKYHPDINPDTLDIFKEIVEAYDVLSDSKKRKNYDKMIKQAEINKHNQLTLYEQTNSYVQSSKSSYDKSLENIKMLNELVCNEIRKIEKETIVDRLNYIANSIDQMRIHQLVNEIDGLANTYVTQKRNNYDDCSFETNMYYKNPHKESIFTILYNWSEYRFENAFSSIWKRNFLAIFGALFVYILSLPLIFMTKFLFFLQPNEYKQFKWHWLSHLDYLCYKNDLIATIFWTLLLAFMFSTKIVFDLLYIVYWIFKNIIRFFLLPIAVIVAAILRTFFKIMTLDLKH